MNTDSAFLDLLSSQRELLQQLNQENSSNGRGPVFVVDDDFLTPEQHPYRRFRNCHSSSSTTLLEPSNQAIYDSSSQDNVVYPKRFSLGAAGMELINFPREALDQEDDDDVKYTKQTCSSFDLIDTKKRSKDELLSCLDDVIWAGKKRRFSDSGGFFHTPLAVMDEEFSEGEGANQRRLSISMLSDLPDSIPDDDLLDHPFDFSVTTAPHTPLHSQQETTWAVPTVTPSTTPTSSIRAPAIRSSTNGAAGVDLPKMMDPMERRRKLEALTEAMEKSLKSQQDIHDWDRKMGLKRSHSKTMRLSMRSRKKLKAMLKKQITALNKKHNMRS